MRKKQVFGMCMLALVLGVAACSPSSPADAPTEAVTDIPPTAVETTVPPTAAPTVEVFPTPTEEELAEAAVQVQGQASEPAGPNEFRSDPGTLVGATGNPQLIEFFTYW